MSQYPWQPPSPYQYPAGYGYDPYAAYIAPARRAGILLIVMGFLMIATAFCCGAMSILPREQIEQQLQKMQQSTGQAISVETLRFGVMVMAALLAGMGIPMVVLGLFVRKGGRGAMIGGIVLTGLLIAVGLLMLAAGRAIFWLVPLALFVLQMIWLIQALRAGTQLRMMQMQYQQQYWQHQQQQQMYGQQQLPPQAPPPQSPPPQSPPPTDGGSHGTAS